MILSAIAATVIALTGNFVPHPHPIPLGGVGVVSAAPAITCQAGTVPVLAGSGVLCELPSAVLAESEAFAPVAGVVYPSTLVSSPWGSGFGLGLGVGFGGFGGGWGHHFHR